MPTRVLPFLLMFALSIITASAIEIDRWVAEDLAALDDGDAVAAWTSYSNRTVVGASGFQPTFKKNVTPAGGAAVRFNRHWMVSSSSPFGGATAFSIAIVFKASAPGAGDAAQWYGKSGIVDAEQGGVTADWGTVLDEQGRVAIGSGAPDITTYSPLPSLVDGNYHIAVFTWGGGAQRVYVNNRAVAANTGVSSGARNNNAGFSFGGIHTGENGATRRFVGDLVEVRFYNTALSGAEATNVIRELNDTHLNLNIPRILSFAASTNIIYFGQSATLAWNVTNASFISIDQGVGSVAVPSGNVMVSPTATTTYTLVATNAFGSRSATATIVVDPGIPTAFPINTNTPQNTPLAITLAGADPNGGSLAYSIVTPPAHGMLSGTPPNVTYTPALDYFGDDSFTFKVNDGSFDSPAATVSIKVIPPPTPPSGIVLSTTNILASAQPGSFIAGLRTIDPNETDTHTYVLVPAFGNNSQFTISGNQLLAGASFSGGVGATLSIRLRTTDNTGFSFEQTFALRVIPITDTIVINEIHYNPSNNTVREEFVELYNHTDAPLDLSLWRLSGGVDYVIPSSTILPPRRFLVVAQDPATIQTRYGVSALGPWSGNLGREGEEVRLRDGNNEVVDQVDYRSEFPWPILANGEGPSMQLVHPDLDNDLGSSWRSGALVTPGATNAVFAANAAPNIRQVQHTPRTPGSSSNVLITAKITDPHGVASVQLHIQVVAPGVFIPSILPLNRTQLDSLTTNPSLTNALNPAFEAATNWTTVTMNDDGLNGDEIANDTIYSVLLPSRANRTLVRYRITVTDTLGASRRAPFEDDASLNFAYFVYDGIPAYQGISPAALQALPVYTLITRGSDLDQCTAWFNANDQLPQGLGALRNEGRLHFNWEGVVVYDGEVYDHVTYRLRGANGRYHPGKRSFRIRFKEGRLLEAKDQYGQRFPTKWRELTTGKGQGNRGSVTYALNEVVNYFLWNKVGVPSPLTFHFHFRVMRGANETADPYAGDFWGLNWAQEKYDVNFLETHDLPRGNLYKLVDNYVLGLDELRYQAPFAVTNAADFFNIQNALRGTQGDAWLLAHVNYTNWYRYHAVCEAIRHYDFWPEANKNASWYFEPIYTTANGFFGRLMTLPYDGTDTWGPTWNSGQDISWAGIFSGAHPQLQLEYRNAVRELRDLLFQPDQINPLIDAFARPLRDVAIADHVRWSNAPAPANYRSVGTVGGQAAGPGNLGGLAAYAQDMKNFMFVGGNYGWWLDRNSIGAGGWITRLDTLATDAAIPARPTVTYAGVSGFPVNGLVFQSSPFSDPQGSNTIAATQWRIAEITPAGTVISNPALLKLEWEAAWDSGEIPGFNEFVSIPAANILPDRPYRVRVRHKDTTGRWSRWSPPFEMRPARVDLVTALRNGLVFSEIMYNPPADGATDGDEFEFLELKNVSTNTLDLSGLFFSAGITFAFTNGTMLPAGQTFLLGRNAAALQTRYPGITVNGVYSGRLDNAGETISLSHPHEGVILSVTYDDHAPWPVTPDGFGFSLVLTDSVNGLYGPSAQRFGSPGSDGAASTIGGVVINEVLSSSTSPLVDQIELRNLTSTNVNIGGWYLTDDPAVPFKYRIGDGTIITNGGYQVFDESHFNPTPGVGNSFSFSSLGDEVYLFSGNASFELTGYSHGLQFDGAPDGVSFGRYVNSVGDEQFPLQISRTFGSGNSGPRIGPIVFSEIHYNPVAAVDEFIEFRNITGSEVPLYDAANPTNRWSINGLGGFVFPSGSSIPGNGYLLLVSGEPTAFRGRHDVPGAIQILQYAGSLQDSGENLELLAPATPKTNGVPLYVVDAVRYNDRAPWPVAADGAGASLQRGVTTAYGDDPTHWLAATPNPGSLMPPGFGPPGILTQPKGSTNIAYSDVSFTVTASGAPPLRYQWRFGNDNIPGATNSVLVLTNVQPSQAGSYSIVIFNVGGSVQSSNALLTLRIPPSIIRHPTNISVRIRPDPAAAAMTNVTFCVIATSLNPPLNFQWRFNGADIPGANAFCYTVQNVQLANEGAYSVVVSDSVGPVASESALLIPLISPTFTHHPVSQSVAVGNDVTLSVGVAGHPPPFTFEWRRGGVPVITNVVSDRADFFTFTAPNTVSTQQFRVVVKNPANFQPGILSSAANVVTLTDTDADNIPDEWEEYYGFNIFAGSDRDFDADLDNMVNFQEYLAGTNPTNSASVLRLELAITGGESVLSLSAVSNRTYAIEFANEVAGPWLRLVDVLARATNRIEVITDQIASNRYYRVVTPRRP